MSAHLLALMRWCQKWITYRDLASLIARPVELPLGHLGALGEGDLALGEQLTLAGSGLQKHALLASRGDRHGALPLRAQPATLLGRG